MGRLFYCICHHWLPPECQAINALVPAFEIFDTISFTSTNVTLTRHCHVQHVHDSAYIADWLTVLCGSLKHAYAF